MKKILTLIVAALVLLISLSVTATATLITDGDHTLGLYGIQWENGVPEETRFPDAIAGILPEVFLENEYFGASGSTGFIMVANWYEEEKFLTSGVDYQGNTLNLYQNSSITTENFENWNMWWIGYSFSGGTVLDDITRMFATINYGEHNISEEIAREYSSSPVPEPASILLFASGILGLAAIRRKK